MKSLKLIILMSLITSAPLLMAMDSDSDEESEQSLTNNDLALISSEQAWAAEQQWAQAYQKIKMQREEEEEENLKPKKMRIIEHFRGMNPAEIEALTDDALWEIMGYDAQQTQQQPALCNELHNLIQLIDDPQPENDARTERLTAFYLQNIASNIQISDDPNYLRYGHYIWLCAKRNDMQRNDRRKRIKTEKVK